MPNTGKKRTRRDSSPDPLALEDEAKSASLSRQLHVPPSSQPTSSNPHTPSDRVQHQTLAAVSSPHRPRPLAVENLSGLLKKRKDTIESSGDVSSGDETPVPVSPSEKKRTRTSLGRSSPVQVESDSSPRIGRGKVGNDGGKTSTPTVIKSTKKETSTPKPAISRTATTKVITSSSKRPNKTLATALAESSPSFSLRKKSAGTPTVPLRSFDDEVFGSPSTSKSASGKSKISGDHVTEDIESDGITQEAFRSNEALRKQREARNFVYEGDASAPKLTRSGRVIAGANPESRRDEYGASADPRFGDEGGEGKGSEGMGMDALEEIDALDYMTMSSRGQEKEMTELEMDVQAKQDIQPLPYGARPYVREILSTLTSQNVASRPPPFLDEDKNEALQGLVNLLRGTVDRGEGNSALILGARGVGKTRTIARALNLLSSKSSASTSPIVVHLSGLAQTNDRLAIREMGRQIAEAEGKRIDEADDEQDEEEVTEEYAPTTLPSHLLALLTAPSPRAIVIIIEEFDLFTEHARQALLYCLLDVVQSIKTGPVDTTGRGVAVIGVTTRVDTLLLLEKRVKSRFSHRMWRVVSPLSPEGLGWRKLLLQALVPWDIDKDIEEQEDRQVMKWQGDWQFAIEMLLGQDKVIRALERLSGLTTDVRILYKPFIIPVASVLYGTLDFISIARATTSILSSIEESGWGLSHSKLHGLPQPALGILIIAKHLAYAGRDDFNLSMVEDEYMRFARTKLVGSGRVRWPVGVLRSAFQQLCRIGLLVPASTGHSRPQFMKVRCVMSPHEVVAYFKGEGGASLGPELVNWGKMMGGHA